MLYRLVVLLLMLVNVAVCARADTAPADVRAQMRPGGVSRQYSVYTAGGGHQQIEFHVYQAPRASEKIPEDATADFSGKPPPRVYFVDVFERSSNYLHRLNTLYFTMGSEFVMSAETDFKWLRPGEKKGPIFISRLGESDGAGAVLVVFPAGISGPSYVQKFISGGEGDRGVDQTFDGEDSRGYMVVTEETDQEKPHIHTEKRLIWTGDQFSVDSRSRAYFVIANTSATRDIAERFIRDHNLWDTAVVVDTSQYPLLAPKLFAVVVGMADVSSKANSIAAKFTKRGIKCYFKKAV